MIFGEVLFDCFPDGQKVLGGAPFNVAWHLQSLGDNPLFISRVGCDELGEKIRETMQMHKMDIGALQMDETYPTGQVQVDIVNDEPHYTIKPDSAFDFISAESISVPDTSVLLYHGTLALRNPDSSKALEIVVENANVSRFLDVNLREPWWSQERVRQLLGHSRWVKVNEDELSQLANKISDTESMMHQVQSDYDLELLVVTLGERGALGLSQTEEFVSVKPLSVKKLIDTVGAGDAFSSVLIHGIINSWDLKETMEKAQAFASQIVQIRGAIPVDEELYQNILEQN